MRTLDDEIRGLGGDLLDEALSKNHVMVVKYAASRERGRLIRRQVDEIHSTRTSGGVAAMIVADKVRLLRGRPALYLPEFLRRGGGELVGVTFNLRTNVGADFVYNQLSGTSVAVADTLALSNNTLATAVTDTAATLPWSTAQATNAASAGTTGEWTALGLARKVATTNSHTASATTYSLAATWTAGGTATGTSKIGLFGGSTKATAQSAAATNILVLVNTFTATDLVINDQLTVTWTITI